MNNPPTLDTPPEAPAVPLEPNGFSTISKRWPHLLLGVAIAMGIFGIGSGPANPYLIWLPLALLVSWALLQILFLPRPPKPEPEYPADAPYVPDAAAAVEAQAAPSTIVAVTAVPEPKAAPKKAAIPVENLSGVIILWGSETGTAEGLAEMTQAKLQNAGLTAQAVDMSAMSPENLQGCSQLLVITSTWGDGEPPSNAISLWEGLQKETLDFSKMRFSVLSLGDTAYPLFCQCGKDFDKFLESHGAKRVYPRVDCDLDYEAPFEKWLSGVVPAMQSQPAAV
jgi:flavodoxin